MGVLCWRAGQQIFLSRSVNMRAVLNFFLLLRNRCLGSSRNASNNVREGDYIFSESIEKIAQVENSCGKSQSSPTPTIFHGYFCHFCTRVFSLFSFLLHARRTKNKKRLLIFKQRTHVINLWIWHKKFHRRMIDSINIRTYTVIINLKLQKTCTMYLIYLLWNVLLVYRKHATQM